MIIVTAASQQYFGALINLIGSIHYWAPDTRILVYDLGIKQGLLAEILDWKYVTLAERFLDREFPPHLSELFCYAWKPAAIADAIHQHEQVLWIDAGSDVRGPLDRISALLSEDGHFFVCGQDTDMTLKSQDNTYSEMGHDKSEFTGKEHFSANLQGYVRGSRAHLEILNPMLEFAMRPQVIAPQGSNLRNHRFDQTVLSILLYSAGFRVNEHTELLAAERNQLNSDPMLAGHRLIYTSRGKSREYVYHVRNKQGQLKYSADLLAKHEHR